MFLRNFLFGLFFSSSRLNHLLFLLLWLGLCVVAFSMVVMVALLFVFLDHFFVVGSNNIRES